MLKFRLAVQGRISELGGKNSINIDKFFRTLSMYDRAKEVVKNYDENSEY